MNTLFIKQVFGIFAKDLRCELRDRRHFFSILFFGLLLLLLFSFSLSVEPELMRKMAAGLFWLAILFSSLLSLGDSFRRETEEGQWDGLLLLGGDPKALYLGKMLANLSFILLVQLFLLPLMALLFDLPLSFSLVSILFLGSFGIAALGTFYAGLTTSFREGGVLLPLLLFPMLVPLLLAAVKVTGLLLIHDIFGEEVAWLKLLLIFDTVFFLGSLVLSELLFDGG
jgi:heme exporter protein B